MHPTILTIKQSIPNRGVGHVTSNGSQGQTEPFQLSIINSCSSCCNFPLLILLTYLFTTWEHPLKWNHTNEIALVNFLKRSRQRPGTKHLYENNDVSIVRTYCWFAGVSQTLTLLCRTTRPVFPKHELLSQMSLEVDKGIQTGRQSDIIIFCTCAWYIFFKSCPFVQVVIEHSYRVESSVTLFLIYRGFCTLPTKRTIPFFLSKKTKGWSTLKSR